jgi:subtilisin family serine protease
MKRVRTASVLHIKGPRGEDVPSIGHLIFDSRQGEQEALRLEQLAPGRLGYALAHDAQPIVAIIVPEKSGYWSTRSEECWDGAEILCETLDDADEPSWWHRLLGEHVDDPKRGSGIKIGVVDSGFAPMAGIDHIVRREVSEPPPMVFAKRGFWRHGEIVCRIIGDRGAPAAAAAIAPGAELYFSNASFSRATLDDAAFRFPADDGSPDDELDPRLVNRAVRDLAELVGVDILNLSLGSFEPPLEASGLAQTIRSARENGTIVIVAAGNEPRNEAAFPANMEECIGVGAFGATEWGADGSVARYLSDGANKEQLGALDELEIFYYEESAWGDGVNLVAPGVGIITSRDGKLAFDVTGTSFAAPIVSGLLAVALAQDEHYLDLPRDESRARYAEEKLATLCRDSGFDVEGNYGLPSLG